MFVRQCQLVGAWFETRRSPHGVTTSSGLTMDNSNPQGVELNTLLKKSGTKRWHSLRSSRFRFLLALLRRLALALIRFQALSPYSEFKQCFLHAAYILPNQR